MRHRRKGRKLGRNPKHQRALLRSLASALFLTERDSEFDDNAPKVKGRITTTVSKAKEVRPFVEKCITIARRGLQAEDAARPFSTDSDSGTDSYKAWRTSEQWQRWSSAIAPAVQARRRCLQLLGDKQAVRILFEEVAPRFTERPGGYTRIVRLAKPRLGDNAPQAILEFVGERDRVAEKSAKPQFDDADEVDTEEVDTEEVDTEEVDTEEVSSDEIGEAPADDRSGEVTAEDGSGDDTDSEKQE